MSKPGVERGFRFQVQLVDGDVHIFVNDGVLSGQLIIDHGRSINDHIYVAMRELQALIWSLPTTRKPSKLWLEANGVELDDPATE